MSASVFSELVAVIGGMGPAAGVLLQDLVVKRRKGVSGDSDHVPLLAYTNPQVPPRTGERGRECVPEIVRTIKMMEKAGATRFVVACNTAHIYAEEIQAGASIPMLSLIECTVSHTIGLLGGSGCVGLMGTSSLIDGQVFQKMIEQMAPALKVAVLARDEQLKLNKLILSIKAGDCGEGNRKDARRFVQLLFDQGATAVIAACTELPLVLNESEFPELIDKMVDPMTVVADEIIRITLASGSNGTA